LTIYSKARQAIVSKRWYDIDLDSAFRMIIFVEIAKSRDYNGCRCVTI